MKENSKNYKKVLSWLIFLILLGGLIFVSYLFYKTRNNLKITKIDLENTKLDLAELQKIIENIKNELETEKYKNSLFAGQISEILGTVGTLDKLSKTDKELLQKYSKVYFLNEHYVPDDLTLLPPDYLYESNRELKIHTKVYPYLQNLLVEAAKAGIDLKIISAYRSFGEQSVLKNSYSVNYGSGANRFSADQGYSEHQLGTTLDFTTSKLGSNFTAFAKSLSYKWLLENAYKYGFVLSYPEGNTYYQFEPWHWRFVGVKLATMLKEEKKNFYDLEQSKIDAYLISIFD